MQNDNMVSIYLKSVFSVPVMESEEETTFSYQLRNARADIATIFLKLPDVYREQVLGDDSNGPALGINWPLKDMETCYDRMIALPSNEGGRDVSALLAEAKRLKRCIDYCRETMILSHLRYVVYLVKQVNTKSISFMDLVQEGTIGLMEAVERYEPTRGFRLKTFAYWWIRKAIFGALSEKSTTIRLPAYVHGKVRQMRATSSDLTKSLGRTPTMQEISNETRIPVPKAAEYLQAAWSAKPLEEHPDEHGSLDLLRHLAAPDSPDPLERTVSQDMKQKIVDALSHLSPRQELIVRLHYGISGGTVHTLREIGQILNLSRERVRQIEGKAVSSLSLYIGTAPSKQNGSVTSAGYR